MKALTTAELKALSIGSLIGQIHYDLPVKLKAFGEGDAQTFATENLFGLPPHRTHFFTADEDWLLWERADLIVVAQKIDDLINSLVPLQGGTIMGRRVLKRT